MSNPIRLAITAGEPSGIGPELVIQIAQKEQPAELVVIANRNLLKERAELIKLPISLKDFTPDSTSTQHKPGELLILDCPMPAQSEPGRLSTSNTQYVLDTLDTAIHGCQQRWFSAMVTAPVHKAIINDAGFPFTGHTEYLQTHTQSDQVVMLLATHGLKVALATTHLPLRDVADAITRDTLKRTLIILQQDLKTKFGINNPRILVAGLNPHAGEGGHLGTEEINIIEPTLNELRKEGFNLIGPLPADTLFTQKYLADADAVLAMYHDQGLPVLKYKGFGAAANITLGLPIIRTSVDHGTALELAGTGKADDGSLTTAIQFAYTMAKMRTQN